MKRLLSAVKFLLAIVGVVLFFYRNSLFEGFAKSGTGTADATHRVLVNNHGSLSYITSSQSDHLRNLVIGSVALFGLAVIVDILQRTILKAPP
jgi:hypothetical protein